MMVTVCLFVSLLAFFPGSHSQSSNLPPDEVYRLLCLVSKGPVYSADPTDYCSLVETLDEQPQFAKFTTDLKQNALSFRNDTNYTVFAPNDAAFGRQSQLSTRADGENGVSPALALLFVDRGRSPLDLAAQAATLKTNLTDPRYVNLGYGIPANIVSEPESGTGPQRIVLTAGLGKRATIRLSEMEFSGGIILESESVPALPEPFDVTLRETNGTRFLDALKKTGQMRTIVETPKITAFVPADNVFGGRQMNTSVLRQHVLQDFLGYTPDLIDGRTQTTMDGTSVTISYQRDAYYVNNARVIWPNVITKNGVIHYIDSFIEPSTPSGAGSATSSDSANPSSADTRYTIDVMLLAISVLASVLVGAS